MNMDSKNFGAFEPYELSNYLIAVCEEDQSSDQPNGEYTNKFCFSSHFSLPC